MRNFSDQGRIRYQIVSDQTYQISDRIRSDVSDIRSYQIRRIRYQIVSDQTYQISDRIRSDVSDIRSYQIRRIRYQIVSDQTYQISDRIRSYYLQQERGVVEDCGLNFSSEYRGYCSQGNLVEALGIVTWANLRNYCLMMIFSTCLMVIFITCLTMVLLPVL